MPGVPSGGDIGLTTGFQAGTGLLEDGCACSSSSRGHLALARGKALKLWFRNFICILMCCGVREPEKLEDFIIWQLHSVSVLNYAALLQFSSLLWFSAGPFRAGGSEADRFFTSALHFCHNPGNSCHNWYQSGYLHPHYNFRVLEKCQSLVSTGKWFFSGVYTLQEIPGLNG